MQYTLFIHLKKKNASDHSSLRSYIRRILVRVNQFVHSVLKYTKRSELSENTSITLVTIK